MVYMGSKDRNSKRNAPKERYNNLKILLNSRDFSREMKAINNN